MAGTVIGDRGEERLRKNEWAVTHFRFAHRKVACERAITYWFDECSPNSCPLGALEYVLYLETGPLQV